MGVTNVLWHGMSRKTDRVKKKEHTQQVKTTVKQNIHEVNGKKRKKERKKHEPKQTHHEGNMQ